MLSGAGHLPRSVNSRGYLERYYKGSKFDPDLDIFHSIGSTLRVSSTISIAKNNSQNIQRHFCNVFVY